MSGSAPPADGAHNQVPEPDLDAALYNRLVTQFAELSHRDEEARRSEDTLQRMRCDTKLKNAFEATSLHEFLSEDVVFYFEELDRLVRARADEEIGAMVQALRQAVNAQVVDAYRHIREGYTSAFEHLADTPAASLGGFTGPQTNSWPLNRPSVTLAAGGGGARSPNASQSAGRPQRAASLEGNPSRHESAAATGKGPRGSFPGHGTKGKKQLSLHEALSCTTSLVTEALATLLHCEAVRLYVLDEHEQLQLCSTFPFGEVGGNPMNGQYLEVASAKEVHKLVCTQGVAINGGLSHDSVASRRVLEQIQRENESSGLSSIKSCLIWPIPSHLNPSKTFGMIHAVNKVDAGQTVGFGAHDEVVLAEAARLLGCVFSRFPLEYFSHGIGQRITAMLTADCSTMNADRSHLPEVIVDEVDGAAEVGNRCLQADPTFMVYRAPINSIYQSRSQRARANRAETYGISESNITTVEFQITAMNDLWKSGFEENVTMHKECRALGSRLRHSEKLICSILDGLAVIRGMHTVDDIADFLQPFEALSQSGNPSLVDAHVTKALLSLTRNATGTATPTAPTLKAPRSPAVASTYPHSQNCHARLGHNELLELAKERELRFTAPASAVHFDGPENVRRYTTDPQSRRAQVRRVVEVANSLQQPEEIRDRRTRYPQVAAGKVVEKLSGSNSHWRSPTNRSSAFATVPSATACGLPLAAGLPPAARREPRSRDASRPFLLTRPKQR